MELAATRGGHRQFKHPVKNGRVAEETENEIRAAIVFHIEGLREDGSAIPPPTSIVEYLEVAV